MARAGGRPRVGILWRGERGAQRPPEDRGIGPLLDELEAAGAEVVPVPFSDERAEEVRAQLRELAGLLVWVNPIQDGATRQQVDELAEEAGRRGTWVSAHPAVIRKMGTKQVLFETRHLGWGTDTELYRSAGDLEERLVPRLERYGRLVVKQGRGNGGNGVWGVELAQPHAPVTLDSDVFVREAKTMDASSERMSLGELIERAARTVGWSGVLVDQPYQRRLGEGMIRCYLSHGSVVGFARQWPRGLLDPDAGASRRQRAPETADADAPGYRRLRERVEDEWVPEMVRVLGLGTTALPVIWDADFLFGTPDERARGDERYVLCEINVSAVWPFPPSATPLIARNVMARLGATR